VNTKFHTHIKQEVHNRISLSVSIFLPVDTYRGGKGVLTENFQAFTEPKLLLILSYMPF
jgi:hypothetical protein